MFELYDFTCLSYCSSSDLEMLDGIHGGEVVMAKMLLKMLEKSSKIEETTSIKKLERDLINPQNRYMVYEY